jgi:hypothetical protein
MTKVSPEVRQRLDTVRLQQKQRKHKSIDHYMPLLLQAVDRNHMIRGATHNDDTGTVRFLFQGRRIQYYITTNRLLICNALGYTQYIYTPQQMIELILNARANSFQMETDDGELRPTGAGRSTYTPYPRHGGRYSKDT